MKHQQVQRPTSGDVARLAGVSRATVSYVLNKVTTQTISATTRDRILRAAAELGYHPNLAARNLASGTSGVLLHVISSAPMAGLNTAVGGGLNSILARYGIVQSIMFEEPDSRPLIDAIRNLRPIAVVSLLPLPATVVTTLDQAGIPNINMQSELVSAVNTAVGETQVEHLLSRGHRNIAFAHSDEAKNRWLSSARASSVRFACKTRGIDRLLEAEFASDGSNAREIVQAWNRAGVTAACAYNDRVALVVQYGLRQAALRCPDHLAIIGVDADDIGFVSDPPLTSLAFDLSSLITLSFNALLQALGYRTRDLKTESPLVSIVQRASV